MLSFARQFEWRKSDAACARLLRRRGRKCSRIAFRSPRRHRSVPGIEYRRCLVGWRIFVSRRERFRLGRLIKWCAPSRVERGRNRLEPRFLVIIVKHNIGIKVQIDGVVSQQAPDERARRQPCKIACFQGFEYRLAYPCLQRRLAQPNAPLLPRAAQILSESEHRGECRAKD